MKVKITRAGGYDPNVGPDPDYARKIRNTLREQALEAHGAAERAGRELRNALEKMRALTGSIGMDHPATAKLASAVRDTNTATALLAELRARIPQ